MKNLGTSGAALRDVVSGRDDAWRTVDQDGYVLDEILQTCRNTKAARRLLTRLLKRQGLRPMRMITDKLKSYGSARRKLGLSIQRLSHSGLNNRAENSHLPLPKRERIMQRFHSPGGSQRFVSVFSAIRNLFVPSASITTALSRHVHRLGALAQRSKVDRSQRLNTHPPGVDYLTSVSVASPSNQLPGKSLKDTKYFIISKVKKS